MLSCAVLCLRPFSHVMPCQFMLLYCSHMSVCYSACLFVRLSASLFSNPYFIVPVRHTAFASRLSVSELTHPTSPLKSPYSSSPLQCLQVTLTANSVEPLLAESAQHRTVCLSDDLSLAFALAMIDFVEWDLKREAVRVTTARGYSASSVSMNALSLEMLKRCIKWYEYPPFVTAMVLHPPSWAAWRYVRTCVRMYVGLSFLKRYFNSSSLIY